MPIRKLKLKITLEHHEQRLDQILAQWLPKAMGVELSRGRARKLISSGAVYLNRKRIRIASKKIYVGSEIEAHVDLAKLSSADHQPGDDSELIATQILFEDEHLIVVNKPPYLPTQPTLDDARDNLFTQVKDYLRNKYKTADPYLGMHHRLDRDTSGVILFTKTRLANPGIAKGFSEHLFKKTYHALTFRRKDIADFPSEWSIKNFLAQEGKDPSSSKKSPMKYTSVQSGGKKAMTDFKILTVLERGIWVQANPHTGRTHQIRVHLAEGDMPILGDTLYTGHGLGKRPEVDRLMLHASRLEFTHPISGKPVQISSPIPEDFQECLEELGKK